MAVLRPFDFTLHLPPAWPGAGPAFATRGIEQIADPADEPEEKKEGKTKQRYQDANFAWHLGQVAHQDFEK